MQIIEPYAIIADVPDRSAGVALLKKVEWCARISHRSEEAQHEHSWERFLRSVVLKHGDWSVTEHASVTVDAIVDRGIMAEWTRHRLGAYTVESTRFCNYDKRGVSMVAPEGMREEEAEIWQETTEHAAYIYAEMLKNGATPQIARSVLPMSLATRLVCTYNLRNWRHWFLMRTTKEAHPQMRQVSIPLLAQFKAIVPLLYDDIAPMARQADNLAKAR